jgi:signal transduction histidine kinase
MLKSEYFWKLFASHAAVVLAMAAAATAWVRLEGSPEGALLAAAVAGLAVAVALAWHRTQSVRSVLSAVESIVRGAYAQRVPVPSRDELGQIARSFNTMSEELRRSMAMTSADRNKLTAILSSMVEGVVAVDRDERILHMNQVAGRLLGAVPDEVCRRPERRKRRW